MKASKTKLPDVLIIEPTVFADDRGFFMESFNAKVFRDLIGADVEFVQDNHSRSSKNVLRGIHYQVKHTQGKLVRVTEGAVFDVVVDLRRSSPKFGEWVGIELSANNKKQVWIPAGFGHAFLVLSESADFLYKTTDYYHPESERSILWNDPEIGIQWPLAQGIEPWLSEKDAKASVLARADVYN